jgi:hypothetical protein
MIAVNAEMKRAGTTAHRQIHQLPPAWLFGEQNGLPFQPLEARIETSGMGCWDQISLYAKGRLGGNFTASHS